MSLETQIENLTDQITQLTDAVTVLKNVLLEKTILQNTTHGYVDAKSLPADTLEELSKSATILADSIKIEEAPNVSPNGSDTTDTFSDSSQESVTYEQVKQVTIAVSKVDKAKAVAALARFGVKTAKDLKEDQWAEYVVYMTKIACGEIDPESSHE
jgi:hypothetical protein